MAEEYEFNSKSEKSDQRVMESKKVGMDQASVLDSSLSVSSLKKEIQEARQKWETDMDDNLLRFQFASLLARSSEVEDRYEATLHLEYLVTSSSEYHRDALYLLAVTKYVLEDYDGGRACAEELCRIEPDNHQVKNLFIAIKYKHEKAVQRKKEQDQVQTAIGVGLGVAAVTLVASFFFARKR